MKMRHKKRTTKSRRRKAHGPRPVGSRRVKKRNARNPRSAFTLVEMLVAVALVVLMMSLFASVFQLASGSISVQRGIAENDQRSRSLFTIFRNDIKHRSMKSVLPFTAGEPIAEADDTYFSVTNYDLRKGYFYISENDINNDADDVLQFTVKLDGNNRDYFGQAALLGGLTTNAQFMASNQPSRDDGVPATNSATAGDPVIHDDASNSFAAEITFFLRGGRLYRRVLLIRDPLEDDDDTQPMTNDTPPQNYFDTDHDNDGNTGASSTPTPAYAYTGDFWNDFDFSAHMSENPDGNHLDGAEFHGLSWLENGSDATTFTGAAALANPKNRFGHNHDDGQPREFVLTFEDDPSTTNIDETRFDFIARWTHEETSHPNFNYPQTDSNIGNPMTTVKLFMNNLAGGQDDPDIVDEFEGGPRRAEDLLLANVHAFDIKVWDEALGRFEDVGHNVENSSGNPIGDFHQNERDNTIYGPSGTPVKRVFDTWHPNVEVDDGASPPNTDSDPPFALRDDSDPSNVIPKPLRAIQITIRYLDVSSNQLRQVTLQMSLLPDE